MKTQILVIALILIALWVYYHQNNKLKGKKGASELVENLERNWNQDKEHWKTAEMDYSKKLSELTQDQEQKERTIIGLNESYEKLEGEFKHKGEKLKTYLSQQAEQIGELENIL
ncbi:MAG: hypothetical protein I3270_01645 [Candidatus Moeniiplasma glomeromycotorum]|nr:hypothetical protein [Candidatus Moeniiplasma glomeromycotorum]MCE8162410.1 hypothetical protein [Candidatus Moeniiplasma glomeromycotorum]MCE8166336.1 hypothetical protein [Candidatus Moeniiplasma glomeromycotorum]MCE8166818.1 hypothetical protein [Candidatus Moeniiplasma glomeromycotorum]